MNMTNQKPKAEQEKVKQGCIGCLGIIVLAVIINLMFPDCGSDPPSSSAPSHDKHGAWVMAQMFVEKQLKSPSTASYGSVWSGTLQTADDVVESLGGGHYRVTAWVDSQNSFGATIRTHFVCELEHVGGSRWQCTKLDFSE